MGLPTCALGIKYGQRRPHITNPRYTEGQTRSYRQRMYQQGYE